MRLLTTLVLVGAAAASGKGKGKGKCVDLKAWSDFMGESCSMYARAHQCTADGGYGSGWDRVAWGTFKDNADEKGVTATQACCACGGGKKLAVAKWQCRKSSDCVHGRCLIHRYGKTTIGSCICYPGYKVSAANMTAGIGSCTLSSRVTRRPTNKPTTRAPTTKAPVAVGHTGHPTTRRPTKKPTTKRPTRSPTTPTKKPTTSGLCPAATFDRLFATASTACLPCAVNINSGTTQCGSLNSTYPRRCDLGCASAYLPLHSQCHANLGALLGQNKSKLGIARYDYVARICQVKKANASGVGHIDNCKASLSANLAQINKACCTQAGMCDSANPVPISCTESCGAVFVPWFKQCGKSALSQYSPVYNKMRAFEGVCQREGTVCYSALNCSQLHNMYRKVGSVDSWPTSSGSKRTVCGESDLAYASRNASTLNPSCFGDDDLNLNGWVSAEQLCGNQGARLCTMDELFDGDATGTGCGHDAALSWTSSTGGCGRRQHMAVAGAPGVSAVGAQCMNDTASLAVRCCADTVAAKSSRNRCRYSRTARAFISNTCTSAVSCADLHTRFGGWDVKVSVIGGNSVCGESDSGLDSGTTQCFGSTAKAANDSNMAQSINASLKSSTHGWYGAHSICTRVGTRLCTATELIAGASVSTGCDFNEANAIWSQDRGYGRPVTIAAAGKFQSATCAKYQGLAVNPTTNKIVCTNLTKDLPVRCCADSDPSIGRTCSGSHPLPIRGKDYEGCSSSLTCAQLQNGYGGWPIDAAKGGSKLVCGESDNGLGNGCVHENNKTARSKWTNARGVCGSIGARLCSVSELIANEAGSTGCDTAGENAEGIVDERVWSLTSLDCPRGQYWSVKGRVPQCTNELYSAAVKCCADTSVNKKHICSGTNSRITPPKALNAGDVCYARCPLDKKKGANYFNHCRMCPVDKNGNPGKFTKLDPAHGGAKVVAKLKATDLCGNTTMHGRRYDYYYVCTGDTGTQSPTMPHTTRSPTIRRTRRPTKQPTKKPTAASLAGAIKCANEGGSCKCVGTVQYGAKSTWSKPKQAKGKISCTNAVFGDPLGGVVKSCMCKPMAQN